MTKKISTENEPLTDAERLKNIEVALRKRGLLPSQLLKLEKLREQLRRRSREVSGEVIAEDGEKRPLAEYEAKLNAALQGDVTLDQARAIADGLPCPEAKMTYSVRVNLNDGQGVRTICAGDLYQLVNRVRDAKAKWVPPAKPAPPADPAAALFTGLGA